MKTRIVLLAGAIAAVGAAGPASAIVAPSLTLTQQKAAGDSASNGNGGNHDTTKEERQQCEQADNSITYYGPKAIWPPNHKMRDFKIIARDEGGEQVTMTTLVESSQPLNGPGDGNTDTDYTVDNTPADADSGAGTATNTGQVRAERSGKLKEGRTYTFTSTAVFDDETCTREFTAYVPHDQRNHDNKKSSSKRAGALRTAR